MLFVRTNPGSIISASILSGYASIWGKDTTDMLFKKFSKEIKNTYYGQKIREYITLNKNIKIGDKYADFSEQNTQGENIKLSDFNGKVVLLEFWGSWCGPCREGNPELAKIYNEFNRKGFEILGVAAETNKEQWLKAIETDKLPWANVTDFNGDKNKAALIYGISYYPANFLIDRNGIIIAKDLRGEKLREKIMEIL
jgi:peroxiredoxin